MVYPKKVKATGNEMEVDQEGGITTQLKEVITDQGSGFLLGYVHIKKRNVPVELMHSMHLQMEETQLEIPSIVDITLTKLGSEGSEIAVSDTSIADGAVQRALSGSKAASWQFVGSAQVSQSVIAMSEPAARVLGPRSSVAKASQSEVGERQRVMEGLQSRSRPSSRVKQEDSRTEVDWHDSVSQVRAPSAVQSVAAPSAAVASSAAASARSHLSARDGVLASGRAVGSRARSDFTQISVPPALPTIRELNMAVIASRFTISTNIFQWRPAAIEEHLAQGKTPQGLTCDMRPSINCLAFGFCTREMCYETASQLYTDAVWQTPGFEKQIDMFPINCICNPSPYSSRN